MPRSTSWCPARSPTARKNSTKSCATARSSIRARASVAELADLRPAPAEADGLGREVDDAREELLEIALLDAGDRVLVLIEGAVYGVPVARREIALGGRQDLLLFFPHVLPM